MGDEDKARRRLKGEPWVVGLQGIVVYRVLLAMTSEEARSGLQLKEEKKRGRK